MARATIATTLALAICAATAPALAEQEPGVYFGARTEIPARSQELLGRSLLAAGSTGFIAVVLLAGLAVDADREAAAIAERDAPLDQEEQRAYGLAVTRRDHFLLGTAVAGSIALGGTVAGIVLLSVASDADEGARAPTPAATLGAGSMGSAAWGLTLRASF